MNKNRPSYPIIYVRGYAATLGEVDATTADPYMGFNLGSAMIRQDSELKSVPFIFESPLLRLIKDHGYVDAYQNGGLNYEKERAPARSIWIYRYYEDVSTSLGDGQRRSIEQFAEGLREFILQVRNAVCGSDAQAKSAFRVYLVAHSMGGLVCRAYLQNICRYGILGQTERNKSLELNEGKPTDHLVDKVFTYGTPHNGIELGTFNVPNLGPFDRMQIGNFDRGRMSQYLKVSSEKDANSLDGAFPAERFFCLIGSNYKDYEAFYGLSKKATGSASDGLVMMKNAYVQEAPRAVIFRSHSGPHGIVNSEAGYQNLRRFLFGDFRITVSLEVLDLPLPTMIQKEKDAGKEIGGAYHFDVAAHVRAGANYHLHERRYSQASAIVEKYDEIKNKGKSIYLFTGYLLEDARKANDHALMFAIDLGVRVPAFEVNKKFWFAHYIDGFTYDETLTFAVRKTSVRYGLRSEHGHGQAPKALEIKELGNGIREIRQPIGTKKGIRPGFIGELILRIEPWA